MQFFQKMFRHAGFCDMIATSYPKSAFLCFFFLQFSVCFSVILSLVSFLLILLACHNIFHQHFDPYFTSFLSFLFLHSPCPAVRKKLRGGRGVYDAKCQTCGVRTLPAVRLFFVGMPADRNSCRP